MNLILLNATCVGEKPDGIAVYCRELIRRILAQQKDNHYIVYINRRGIKEMSFLSNRDDVSLNILPGLFSPDFGFIGHILRLCFSQYLAFRYPRILIFSPSQLEACFYNKNQVLMVHDLIPMLFHNDPLLRHTKQYYFFKYILGAAIRNSGAVISPSLHTLEMINQRFFPDPGKLFTIQNGINFPKIIPIDDIKRKENFILYLGRLSPTKNVAGLINAYRKIADQIPHKLVIAGGGDNVGLKNGDPGGQGTVEYAGYVSDEKVEKLLTTAALFVFPSFYEGFGFPPLEAMARGCPVVVSNVASLPEVCGEAALYVDPRSSDSIADTMIKAINDESIRKSLIQYGYERANQFTWQRSANKHLEVFDFVQKGMN